MGGGQGSGRPGEKGAGGVREAGEEGAGSGIPKVAGSGRKREKLRNIAQYFAIEKMQRGGIQKIQGREPGLKGTGSGRFKPPCPPPPPIVVLAKHQFTVKFTELSVDLLIILGERYLFVCCSFCFVKRGNSHYSVHVINTSRKPSNENSETRCDKTEYILHCCCTSLLQVRDSLRQTERHSQERKKW